MIHFGWGDPTDEVSQTKIKAQKLFDAISSKDERFTTFETPTDRQRLMGWEFTRKVYGGDLPNYAQPIGSCVGYGAKNAIEYTSAFEVATGELEEFKLMYLPYIWAGCRKKGGYRRKGEGSYGSAAAQAVMDYGTLFHDIPGLPVHYIDYDANNPRDPKVQNNARLETDWSGPDRDGTWDFEKYLNDGRKYQVKSTAKITTWEQAVSAICNGYFLTIASSQGFEMRARSDGFHYPKGSWAHQMCHLPQTLISEQFTTKPIEDIQIGDMVYSSDGNLNRVSKKLKRKYKGIVYEIKCYGATKVIVTPEHPLLVEKTKHSKTGIIHKISPEWNTPDKLEIGQYLLSPKLKPIKEPIPEINISNKRCRNKPSNIYNDDDISWFIGLYVADGCARRNHKIEITLNKHEIEFANRCIQAIEKLGLKGYIYQKENCIRVCAYSSDLANYFYQWFGKGINKTLPNWVYNLNLQELVNGAFHGDGCLIRGNRKRIANTSYKLVYQLHNILQVLGYNPYLSEIKSKRYKNFQRIYNLEWDENQDSRYNKSYNNGVLKKIQYIKTYEYDGYVYNFEVENTHNYIANTIVSHNCAIGIDNEHKDPHVYILNSWGKNLHGQLKDFITGENLPLGILRVRASVFVSMMQDECYIYSKYNGFPRKILPSDVEGI